MKLLFEENYIPEKEIPDNFHQFPIIGFNNLMDREKLFNPQIFFGLLTTYERFEFLIWVYDENKFHKNSLLQNIFNYIDKKNLRNMLF